MTDWRQSPQMAVAGMAVPRARQHMNNGNRTCNEASSVACTASCSAVCCMVFTLAFFRSLQARGNIRMPHEANMRLVTALLL